MLSNAAIAERLALFAQLLEILGENKFKVIAHQKGARVIESLTEDIAKLAATGKEGRAALLKIDGIGQGIADKVVELVTTGSIADLEALRAKVPPGLLHLLKISGMGPKTVALVWKEAGVTDLASLQRILADGTFATLPRMGEKAAEKLKVAIDMMSQSAGRVLLGVAMPIAERVAAHMRSVRGVSRTAFAGSLRRGKETIGDLDILVATTDPAAASDAFCTMPGVRQVIAKGENKCSIMVTIDPDLGRWGDGLEKPEPAGPEDHRPTIQVDLRIIPDASWGAALMYFTGSKEHNVKLRERALSMGLTLNEYGLFPDDEDKTPPQHRGIKSVASATEEAVFAALKLPFIPPELREDRGETALVATPVLIEVADIKAELHAHTTASDGRMQIEELALLAKARGFHTIAVTDHSQSSAIAGGLKPKDLRQHIKDVRSAAQTVTGISILTGSEVDILADGTLDYDDELLNALDVVVASPHASLSQDPPTATARLLKAIAHPSVHILGHPTGRLIGRRKGLEPDMGALIAACKQHNVALEINAHWMRLDLRDTHVRAAVDAGCLIAINCDTHDASDADNLIFGVITGRRGGLPPQQCVNTWPKAKLHAWLKSKR